MINVCFLYHRLPLDLGKVAEARFTGALSVDAHLDTVLNGLLKFVPEATVFLLDGQDIHKLFRFKEGAVTAVESGSDAALCRFDILFVSPYAIHSLDEVLDTYSAAKTVLSIPAVWWYEHPDLYPYELLEKNINDFRRLNTCFIVPNERIRDYLIRFAMLYTGLDVSEHVMMVPYFVHTFYERQPDRRETLIVDSGGPWRWTANHIFAEAFVAYCNDNPTTKLRFAFSVKDQSNPDHEEYQRNILATYRKLENPGMVYIIEWSQKDELHTYLSIASYGLSVNVDTVEAYLSSRVRLRDYVSHKLPIITTDDNVFYRLNRDICVLVEPTVTDFLRLFRDMEAAPKPLQEGNYDIEIYQAEYARAIRTAIKAIRLAPAGSSTLRKSDIKCAPADLERIYGMQGAGNLLRKFAYRVPAGEFTRFLRGVLSDAKLRQAIQSDRELLDTLADFPTSPDLCSRRREIQTLAYVHLDYGESGQSISAMQKRLQDIEQSTYWRAGRPLRQLMSRYPHGRQIVRRGGKLGWWILTFQLAQKLRDRRQRRGPPGARR